MVNEQGYLNLVRKVLKYGEWQSNRTGVDTLCLFGEMLQFDLRDSTLPMITTKHVSFSTILKELLWFKNGDTNQKHLEEKNVFIWKANSTRQFLDSRGLTSYKAEETLGPIYGFQWRHFGAPYIDANTNYAGKGVDQLKQVIEMLKTNPTSRRIIMSAWNPVQLDEMALPPCHVLSQFHVNMNRQELSCIMFQRSGDLMLGVPYNITSYSLLTHILAKLCGWKTGTFKVCLGNVHIYENHVENAKLQLKRSPFDPPKIELMFNHQQRHDIDELEERHFKLIGYKHHPKIQFDMIA